jgi:hypothetical protein
MFLVGRQHTFRDGSDLRSEMLGRDVEVTLHLSKMLLELFVSHAFILSPTGE